MLKRGIVIAGMFLMTGVVPAFAQGKVEVSGFLGWALAVVLGGVGGYLGWSAGRDPIAAVLGALLGALFGFLATNLSKRGCKT